MLMRSVRLTSRLLMFSLVLLICALLASVICAIEWLCRRKLDRTPFARFCFALAARVLGFQVRLQGEQPKGAVLLVSNHVSWSDIPILGGLTPLRFLSKVEVRSWPVIGWLAEQAGTLFIRRGGGQARAARERITQTLRCDQSVLVFPEGTTSVGITVLPFHARLLSAAAEAGVPIQPVSIGYRRNDHPDHLAPFVGDDRFEGHLTRMLREPAVTVEVILHQPVTITSDDDMQMLTQALHTTVQDGLRAIHKPDTPGGSPASRPRLSGV